MAPALLLAGVVCCGGAVARESAQHSTALATPGRTPAQVDRGLVVPMPAFPTGWYREVDSRTSAGEESLPLDAGDPGRAWRLEPTGLTWVIGGHVRRSATSFERRGDGWTAEVDVSDGIWRELVAYAGPHDLEHRVILGEPVDIVARYDLEKHRDATLWLIETTRTKENPPTPLRVTTYVLVPLAGPPENVPVPGRGNP
jgi:hypothetical protein